MGAGGMQALSSFRTYLYLARKLKAWVRDALPGTLNQLWERIVFNALVGNSDDHPRNHGLLLEGIQWRLSPMFDVVPARYRLARLSLAMPYLRLATGQETSLVTAQYLVQAAPAFGLDVDTARSRLLAMATRTIDEWPDVLSELKAPADVTHETRPTLDWTRQIITQATSLSVDDCRPIALKANRRWQWTP
jgi:serine/threonine-protein kinase HipA